MSSSAHSSWEPALRSIELTDGELGAWILPPVLSLPHAKTPPVNKDVAMVY